MQANHMVLAKLLEQCVGLFSHSDGQKAAEGLSREILAAEFAQVPCHGS